MSSSSSSKKLGLPSFLKLFTNADVPMTKAMAIAKTIYAKYNTPQDLGVLTDAQLKNAGVESKEDRKIVLNVIKKAGFKSSNRSGIATSVGVVKSSHDIASSEASTSGSASRASAATKNSTSRKRKRDRDLEELTPDLVRTRLEGAELGSFDFHEVVDEQVLASKAAVVNRAPVMTAWATVVAERMGFKREEALSIASAYTEMNAISKGVSLGVFEPGKAKGVELKEGQSQPYVDVMGRSPLYTTQQSQYCALLKGEPISAASAFSYIQRSFRQTMPYVLGAMRLLAETYSPTELNKIGFSLYADFRPEATDWGARSEMRCEKILALRKKIVGRGETETEMGGGDTPGRGREGSEDAAVEGGAVQPGPPVETIPVVKRPKNESESFDDFDDAFDDDIDFNDPSLQGL